MRPATLRGLAPDQTLVLVNSKRRHSSALVNVNGTVGRGSASVDMNTIPTAIVRNIEVLRDGASAQYGSDAISGVVNIRLRTDRSGGEASVTYGARKTEYDVLSDVPPAGANYGAAPDIAQPDRWPDRHRQHVERPALGRERLPHHRRRIQGPEAHRAQRLRHARRPTPK